MREKDNEKEKIEGKESWKQKRIKFRSTKAATYCSDSCEVSRQEGDAGYSREVHRSFDRRSADRGGDRANHGITEEGVGREGGQTNFIP